MFQAKQEKQLRIRPFSTSKKQKRITGLLWTVTIINLAKTQGTQSHLNHINWSQDNCEFFASNLQKFQHEISPSKVSFLPSNQIFYEACIEASKWELITLNIDVEAHLRICEKLTKILQIFHPRDWKFRTTKIAAQSATFATSRFFDARESEPTGASSERHKLMEETANSMQTNSEEKIPRIDGDPSNDLWVLS